MALRSLDGRSVIIWQCVVLLVAITTLYTIGLSILAIRGLGNPEIAPILWSTEVRLILALWVRADREVRRFAVPFEFDAFVFFAWPLVLPYYSVPEHVVDEVCATFWALRSLSYAFCDIRDIWHHPSFVMLPEPGIQFEVVIPWSSL